MNSESKDSTKLKPMHLGESLLYFGIPAVITVLCVFRLFPYLVEQGFSTFVSYMIALDVPLGIMLITSLVSVEVQEELIRTKQRISSFLPI